MELKSILIQVLKSISYILFPYFVIILISIIDPKHVNLNILLVPITGTWGGFRIALMLQRYYINTIIEMIAIIGLTLFIVSWLRKTYSGKVADYQSLRIFQGNWLIMGVSFSIMLLLLFLTKLLGLVIIWSGGLERYIFSSSVFFTKIIVNSLLFSSALLYELSRRTIDINGEYDQVNRDGIMYPHSDSSINNQSHPILTIDGGNYWYILLIGIRHALPRFFGYYMITCIIFKAPDFVYQSIMILSQPTSLTILFYFTIKFFILFAVIDFILSLMIMVIHEPETGKIVKNQNRTGNLIGSLNIIGFLVLIFESVLYFIQYLQYKINIARSQPAGNRSYNVSPLGMFQRGHILGTNSAKSDLGYVLILSMFNFVGPLLFGITIFVNKTNLPSI